MARIRECLRHYGLEIGYSALLFALVVFQQRASLIFGTHTYTGDTLVWGYPGFYFFAHQIWNGEFPLWSPFSHGGEPFYPVLLQRRLLDPLSWIFVLTAKVFSPRPVLLFNWHLIFQSAILGTGTYLLFRDLTRVKWIRLWFLTVIFFSSYLLSSFRQIGTISQFLYLPFYLLCFRKLFWDGRRGPVWFWGLILTFGLGFQSYWFSGLSVISLFAALPCFVFRRRHLTREWRRLPLWSLLLLIGFALPNLSALHEKARFVYPLRMLPVTESTSGTMPLQTEGSPANPMADLEMKYDFIARTGSPGTIWDLLQALSPLGNRNGPISSRFGNPTAAFLYLGFLSWALIILGIGSFQPEHRFWLPFTALNLWLFLGDPAGLQPFLHAVFPPLRYLRHTLTFIAPLTIGLFYFLIVGANRLETSRRNNLPRGFLYLIAVHGLLVLRFSPDPKTWLGWALGSMVIPYTLFALFRRQRYAPIFLLLAVSFDLFLARGHWGLLYRAQRDPLSELGVPNDFSRPRTAKIRGVSAPIPVVPDADDEQTIRYLAHLRREPFALSERFPGEFPINRPDSSALSFSEALARPRWNSYHLLRDYFDLLHSGQSPEVIGRALGVGLEPWEVSSGNYQIDSLAYGKILLSVETPVASVLRRREAWDPFWRLTVDGVATPISRNGFQQFVSLPPGRHQLKFTYRPWAFLTGVIGFWIASLVGVIGCLFSLTRRHS